MRKSGKVKKSIKNSMFNLKCPNKYQLKGNECVFYGKTF